METARALLHASDRFRRFVSRMGITSPELEDVTQEAMLQIWEARAQIDPSENVLAWAYRVVANVARDHLRRVRRRQEIVMPFDDDDNIDGRDEDADPEADAECARRLQVLRQLIDQIDPTRRRIFVEHQLLGKPLQDIAAEQGISFDTARKRLASAWGDFRRAGKRWQARQGTKDTEPGAMLPIAPDARTSIWHRDRTQHTVIQGLGFAAGLVIVAACVSSTTPSPSVLSALPSIPRPILAATTAQAPGATETNHAPAQVSAAPPSIMRPPARTSATEASLIMQAEMFLASCALAQARQTLARHEREFPEGQLSSKRDALRKILDTLPLEGSIHKGCRALSVARTRR